MPTLISDGEVQSNLLKTLDHWQQRIERALNGIGGGLIFVMMLAVVAEVLSRGLLNTSIAGQIDFIELAVPCATMLGLAFCHQQGSQIRMTAVIQNLSGRPLWLAELITTIASLGLFGFLMLATWSVAIRSVQMGGTTMEVNLPVWPTKVIISLGITMLFMRLILQLIGFIRLVKDPKTEPIGVPRFHGVDLLEQQRALDSATTSSKEPT